MKESLERFRKIQATILEFLEKNDDVEEVFEKLKQSLDFQKKGTENLYDITLLLHLLASITENHYLESDFYSKLEKILLFLKDEITEKCTDSDIFNIFKNNKKVLLFLFEEQLLKMNNYIALQMQSKKFMKKNYHLYFFPELKPYLKSKKERKCISKNHLFYMANEFYKKSDLSGFMLVSREIHENDAEEKKVQDSWFSEFSEEFPDDFYENRKNGQNKSEICQLIQKDSIDDFISYVGRQNYPLTSTIDILYYETNSFLLSRPKPKLIEYASFFGSVQIFKYLFKNGVKLTPSIWQYAIHSNNPELIHLLEDCKIEPKSYLQIYNEAIRCHHNAIAHYINNNYLSNEEEKKEEEEKKK